MSPNVQTPRSEIGPDTGTGFGEDTLPKLLRKHFLERPDEVAMRVKYQGIWYPYTWKQYYRNVKNLCLGLLRIGLKRGDHVSVLGENKPEWYWAELAVQCAGGGVLGIFVDCTPPEVKYYVEHSDSTFVVAHDQEQVDKLLAVKEELPQVKKVIYWDAKGLWNYDDPLLMSFEDVLEIGAAYDREQPGLFDELINEGKSTDTAAICYSSGTTGLPKGAMLSQSCLVDSAREWSQTDGWFQRKYQYVSFIPPAWIPEQALGVAGSLVAGVVVNFPEEPETVQEDLREIGPELLFYPAKLWESLNRMVQAKMMDSTFLRRLMYRTLLPVGLKAVDKYAGKSKPNLFWRGLYTLAYYALLRQLRDRIGLTKARVVYSAGAALSPEIIKYFRVLGVDIKLTYGSTEMGTVSVPPDGEIRPETSGKPVPWVEVRISEEGEILVKSRFMFSGYYKNISATEAKFRDGWFCSGDFGYIDEQGHLIVIDRMEDLQPLSGGKKFSPQYAEVRLRFSPYIRDAFVVGGEFRGFVSALVNIDIENVGRYAEAHRIPYTSYTDLSQKPIVIELVMREINNINRTLPEHARIARFVNIHKEFDADEEELTRTRKLRRSVVEQRYSELIDALYSDRSELIVETPVTYRDGRSGVISTAIRVNEVNR